MDLLVLISIFVALLVVLLTLYFLKSKDSKSGKWIDLFCVTKSSFKISILESSKPAQQQAAPAPVGRNLVRNERRNRVRAAEPQVQQQAAAQQQQNDSDDETGIDVDEKMGTKKRQKLEAKAEKKAQREAEVKSREDQKKRDALADEERKKQDEKEALEEKKREEAERELSSWVNRLFILFNTSLVIQAKPKKKLSVANTKNTWKWKPHLKFKKKDSTRKKRNKMSCFRRLSIT